MTYTYMIQIMNLYQHLAKIVVSVKITILTMGLSSQESFYATNETSPGQRKSVLKKKSQNKDTWVALSIKHPTLSFSSGQFREFENHIRLCT